MNSLLANISPCSFQHVVDGRVIKVENLGRCKKVAGTWMLSDFGSEDFHLPGKHYTNHTSTDLNGSELHLCCLTGQVTRITKGENKMAVDKIKYETAVDEVGPPIIPMPNFKVQIDLAENRYLNLFVQHEDQYTTVSLQPHEVHELIRKLQVGLKYMVSDGTKIMKAVSFDDLKVDEDFTDNNINYTKIELQYVKGPNLSVPFNAISETGEPHYFEACFVTKEIKI